MTKAIELLVGDNPFHGISHLSQERARQRSSLEDDKSIQRATRIVELGLENSAVGFMFTVSDVTLSIIKNLQNCCRNKTVELYAIVPYAYEYVRKATQVGGVAGLAKSLGKEIILSSNAKVVALNFLGLLRFDLSAFLKTYVSYELSRIKSVTNENLHLKTIMLHELLTDMALALDMKDVFESYIRFMEKRGVKQGFETRNFPYLVNKFSDWGFDFNELTLTASFNKVGFQMNPSKIECEEALKRAANAEVIAMSVLAAGYIKPADAVGYFADLKGISGIVVGASKERQAIETFKLFREYLDKKFELVV